jgi:hypothetical protein
VPILHEKKVLKQPNAICQTSKNKNKQNPKQAEREKIKIRAEMNEIETKKPYREIMK